MNMLMVDNISDSSINSTNLRLINSSAVNLYLKSRKDLNRNHNMNLIKLKDSAEQGNELSKRIWRNIEKS